MNGVNAEMIKDALDEVSQIDVDILNKSVETDDYLKGI